MSVGRYIKTTFSISINNQTIISKDGENGTFTESGDGGFTKSNNTIKLNSSYTAAIPYVRVNNITISYK